MQAQVTNIRKKPGYSAIQNTLKTFSLITSGKLPASQKLSASLLEEHEIPSGDSFPVMGTLRFLRFVDEQGYVTPVFVKFAQAAQEEQQDMLREILVRAYEDVFKHFEHIEDIALATSQEMRDAFKEYDYPNLQGKMITLFRGLCRKAGLLPDEDQTRQEPNGQRLEMQPPLIQVNSTNIVEGYKAMPEPPQVSLNGHISTWDYAMIEGLLDAIEVLRQLPNSPKWAEANRQTWLQAIAVNVKLLAELLEGKE